MSKEVSALTFHISAVDIGIENFVNKLLEASNSAVLLRPRKNSLHIHSAEDIQTSLKRWPSWSARPWIIAGNTELHRAAAVYEGPFAENCCGDKIHQQIEILLKNFDWALFSYFTTYHDEIWTFVTSKPDALISQCFHNEQQAIISHYRGTPPVLQAFRNATYSDRSEEGWLPYELAQQRGEGFPFVVSGVYENDQLMDELNEDLGERNEDDTRWYEEPFSRLELVSEISVSGQRYFIHRATDLNAYLKLWSQSSSGLEVADSVFAADCDLNKLTELIKKRNWIDVMRDTEKIATWGYGLIYGGGSDENHAIFHSCNAKITDELWEHVGRTAISRF